MRKLYTYTHKITGETLELPCLFRQLKPNVELTGEHTTGVTDYDNIVVCRMIGLGDVIMAIPTFWAIRNAFPEAQLTVVTSPGGSVMLKGLDFIDRVVISKYKHPSYGRPPPPPEAVPYGTIVNLINAIDFGSICFSAPRADNFLTAAELALKIRLPLPAAYLIPDYPLDTEISTRLRQMFQVPTDKVVIGCQLTSSGKTRVMSLALWEGLFRHAPAEWFFMLFADRKISDLPPLPNIINTTGQLSVAEYVHGISLCTAYVCPDSSGMHLGPIVGTPVVLLAGSTRVEYHTKYYRPKMHFPVYALPKLDCVPCFDWQVRNDCYGKAGLPWCINRIETEKIIDQIKEVIG